MISARFLRHPSQNTAVFIRVTAFVAATIGIVLVPAELAAAAIGYGRVDHALEIIAVAAALIVLATIVARSIDPLRR